MTCANTIGFSDRHGNTIHGEVGPERGGMRSLKSPPLFLFAESKSDPFSLSLSPSFSVQFGGGVRM